MGIFSFLFGSNNESIEKQDDEIVDDNFEYSFYSKVVGVSFNNDNGGSRQELIKKVKVNDELYIQGYKYQEDIAFAVLKKEGDMSSQIGNLSAKVADDLTRADPSTVIKIIVKDVTGGTKDKPSLGVNIEILSTNNI